MSSPRHVGNPPQFQAFDPWDRTPLYAAPTPGNFGRTPTPPACSPPASQIFDEHLNTPRDPHPDQVGYIPFAAWDKEGIHYLVEWKVTLNTKVVARVTEPNLVIAPSIFWQKTLKKKVEGVRRRKVFQDRRVRLDNITIGASINDRSQDDVHQESETIDIDWSVTEEQILKWSNLLRLGKAKGKKLRLDICINYLADDNDPARKGDKRGATSVTKAMLVERDAQIDAEQSSGQPSLWRDVYKTMRCPGSPCENKDGYCWQDPHGKIHYKLRTHHLKRLVDLVKKGLELETHNDVPDEIREQLYAEKQQWLERQRKNPNHPAAQSVCPPININFLPTPSPQAPQLSMMSSPAGSPPLLPYQAPTLVDGIMIPDLPLDKAVVEYTDWQLSQVDTQVYKDNIKKACDIALANGLDLKQIHKDQEPNFFINRGVIVGVARRFVEEIQRWSDNYEPVS